MIIGEQITLRVVRISDLGYMLSDGKEEVLLHFKQALTEHKVDDKVNVFIYSDKNKRATASESIPYCTVSNEGFVEVIDKLPGIGVFVNINTPKDILISKDYLPYEESLWPNVNDKLLIRLKVKKDMLVGKPLNRYDIVALHKNHTYAQFEQVTGYICRISEKGIGIVTNELMYVFVPNAQFRGDHRMGEEVLVTITKSIDSEYYGMLNAQKEEMIFIDRKIILDYLNEHNGVMKLTAKSSAIDVEKILKMSRKAFKRAYGGLYKDGLIRFDDEKTYLCDK